ncbi:MAG: N-6 DNA methylase [Spirochaetales bacterium]|nr:N-6 DNA methylase [Spirochaetales bacterium]
MSDRYLTRKETAAFLGITPDSVRNWTRQGLLDESAGGYTLVSVMALKKRIESGEVDRLSLRANKSCAKSKFIPLEYLENRAALGTIRNLVDFLENADIGLEEALFLLSINLFIKKGDISSLTTPSLKTILQFQESLYPRKCVLDFLSGWYDSLSERGFLAGPDSAAAVGFLLGCELPDEKDLLGIIYQSLLNEGKKSGFGSYYTPREVVRELLAEEVKKGERVLDPCCGTGQFLLSMAESIATPENIYGFDLDKIAVHITRVNLLLKYGDKEFTPHIFHEDTLLNSGRFTGFFDLIGTNPPWGAKYNPDVLEQIRTLFPEVKGKESFSFFIHASYRMLKEGGRMCFVLPESISNIKTHRDIRWFIAHRTRIKSISLLGKRFRNVMSRVLTICMSREEFVEEKSIEKSIEKGRGIKIIDGERTFFIDQRRFLDNRDYLFNIRMDELDELIFDTMINRDWVSLEGRAEWALGIVTGDNRRFLHDRPGKNREPVIRGADIFSYRIRKPEQFIEFTPERFQQTAPEEKYRCERKLVYRFISKRLVFALDETGAIPLNSGNILIPKMEDYPIEVLLAFFNSKLFSYYFIRKFGSVKILRGDLEELPFPLLDGESSEDLKRMVGQIMAKEISIDEIDKYIYGYYKLSSDEIGRIEAVLRD